VNTENDDLPERWNATLSGQPEVGRDLLRRYAEPHRRYHTADHLRHVLTMVDELAGGQDLFLVRLTETHVPGARDPEGELLCDADLAILAAPPDAYARYVEQVRAEYAAVPEQDFLAGRLAVLTELADREIFRTTVGRRLAPAARANLAAELESLTQRLGA